MPLKARKEKVDVANKNHENFRKSIEAELCLLNIPCKKNIYFEEY